jgi:DNA polymerase III subunit epsilon
MKTLWMDLETTGLDPIKDKIVEIAIIYENGEELKTFHKYVYYDVYPESFEYVKNINNLNEDFLKEKGVKESEMYIDLLAFLNSIIEQFDREDKAVIAGYCVNFDIQFLRSLFLNYSNKFYGSYFVSCYVDVFCFIADEVKRDKLKLDNYKLKTVCDYYKVDIKAHSAMSDIESTKQLYKRIQLPF